MSGWIVRIDSSRPGNWQIGKDHDVWGTKQHYRIRRGDDLFFWMTRGGGLVAYAVAADDARPVVSADDVPWPDHAEQSYKWLIPLTGVTEVDPPLTTDWQRMLSWAGLASVGQSTVIAVKDPQATERLGGACRRSLPRTSRVYGGRCCITGCDARPALEAAHISPYRGAHTNPLSNGLLLRADIHTLFDMYYLTVDASTVKVRLTNEWQRSQYGSFHGRMLRPPSSPDAFPDRTALAAHNGEFAVRHGSASGARGGRSTG